MTAPLLVLHGLGASTLVAVSVLAIQSRTVDRAKRMTSILLGLVVVQTVVGDLLYPTYLSTAKPTLRALDAGARTVADVFEVKEHLAFFALVLTLGAFIVVRNEREHVGALSRVLVAAAHAAILLVATLGVVVASVKLP